MSEFFPANKCCFAHGCQALPVARFDATFGFKSSSLNVVLKCASVSGLSSGTISGARMQGCLLVLPAWNVRAHVLSTSQCLLQNFTG